MATFHTDSSAPLSHPSAPLPNLTRRLLTAAVAIPLVLTVTLLGGGWFALAGVVMAGVGMLEFFGFARRRFQHRPLWMLLLIGCGVAYTAIPALMLIWLRAQPDGLTWIALVFTLTWATDTFAYIGGRLYGKRPLAPAISPNKTVEGAAVGILGGMIFGLLLLLLTGQLTPPLIALVIAAPFAAVGGDLFESAIKRFFRAKESHLPGFELFPGHGGVLDRVDSLIAVGVLCSMTIFLVQTFAR